MIHNTELLIIGGGPAGVAAGVYAARKKIKSVLVVEEFGGQSSVSSDIQNFIGITSLEGSDMAKRFKEQLETYKGDALQIVEFDKVVELKEKDGGFEAQTKKGQTLEVKAVLVASGSHRRKLEVSGAERLDNKGISYCATCDAPLFQGMDVAVIGGGNAGFESAEQLTRYAKSVTLFQRGDKFKADPVTVERVMAGGKVNAFLKSEPKEVRGDKFVESLIYKDKEGKENELKVQGIFVEIGSIPNTDFAKGLVDLNEFGEVLIDCKNQRTSREGIWAAGDVTDVRFKQNNISMGDGVKALEDIYFWLLEKY